LGLIAGAKSVTGFYKLHKTKIAFCICQILCSWLIYSELWLGVRPQGKSSWIMSTCWPRLLSYIYPISRTGQLGLGRRFGDAAA